MGVRGLKRFIKDECKLLQDYKLYDTRVVIDGLNLLGQLHGRYRLNTLFGGEYPALEHILTSFFVILRQCDITPYVVFDGGGDSSDRKLQTWENRFQRNIGLVQDFLDTGELGEEWFSLCPKFAESSMKSVLEKLNVPYVVCTFEADEEIAWLAHEWNCPVVSDDSDFAIFDLPAGVIPLDTMELVPAKLEGKNHGWYMKVQIYNHSFLLESFKLKSWDFLPLFASMVGNDYIDASLMEPFYTSVKLPRVYDKRYSNRHQRHKASVLRWLATCRSTESALKTILKTFPEEDQESIRTTLISSIASYATHKSKIGRYFEMFECRSSCTATCDLDNILTYNNCQVPSWMLAQLRFGCMSQRVMDALVLHRVILGGYLEEPNICSAYQAARAVRQITYGILFTLELSSNDTGSASIGQLYEQKRLQDNTPEDKKRAWYVEEWDREGASIVRLRVSPVFSTPDGAQIPHLLCIPSMPSEDKTRFFCHAVDIPADVFITFPSEHRLILAAAAIWIKNASPKVKKTQVLAILAYVAKESVCHHTTEASKRTSSLLTTSSQRSHHELATEMASKFTKHSKYSQEIPHDFDMSITHAYSQFQACVQAVCDLNQLLCCPLPMFTPSRVFSGAFIYSLVRDLDRAWDPKRLVRSCLQMVSQKVEAVFNELYYCLLT